MTIRTRLALAYGLAVALTIAVLGVVVWWQFGVALRASLEQRLETRLVAVEAAAENDGQGGLQEADDEGDVFVVLVGADGGVLDASANAPVTLPVGPYMPGLQEAGADGRRFLLRVDVVEGGMLVVVGADLAATAGSQASLAGLLAVAGMLAILLSVAGGWWLAGRSLRPVAVLTAEAAAIGATDHERRLAEPRRRDELGVLAHTLNEMLARIADASRRQRAFVAAASHDLRTPLAALQAELELADRADAGTDELRAALRAARDDATRLGELAGDLLQLATVAGEGRALALGTVDLADVVATVLRRVAPVADHAGVRVRGDVEQRTVRLDRVRIEQALANLLVNAITYSARGDEVLIGSHPDPGDPALVALHVADRGPGIPRAEREEIFEPFRRGAAARGRGAGLGLATVRAAVEAHGGIVACDERPGGGTVFTLRLPAAG